MVRPESRLSQLLCALLVATAPCSGAFAEPAPSAATAECASMLKECFTRTSGERTSCFLMASAHTFCESSPLGSLAFSRGSLGSSASPEDNAPAAFLGAQPVNQLCIKNFDNSWSSALVQGVPTESQIEQLNTTLERCVVKAPGEMLRP